ncbi:type IV pilin [Natronolimnobius sp. AArcel1]|uniref:type IV pilin n=1 Tax=Natronolimnobius sp. AArcel1 TaxID=1679093 RepID=UPI0013EDB54D|nr:type IV pilin N-terminal domain-containing protein [Natronolimnobius sp. AArcel1]NGM67584.1 type IV pilin [Natronolimnobius sp. AArcel1]
MRSPWGSTTTQRFRDAETAVTPVIGVVLMVAITIILAGTVHAALIGFADEPPEPQPIAGFSFDETDCDGDGVTVTHVAGDSIPADELYLHSPAKSTPTTWENPDGHEPTGLENGMVDAGSSLTTCLGEGTVDDEPVQVIWESPTDDQTAVLAEWDG